MDVQKAMKKLKNKGIDANEKDSLKTIAEKNNTSPIELLIDIFIDEDKISR